MASSLSCVGQTSQPDAAARSQAGKPDLRAGMTLVETTVALAIIGVLGVIIAQTLVWSLRERVRLTAHHAALELAANTLETARAQPWEQLDQAWADAQTIPADMSALLPEGKILVTVAAWQPMPQARRLTVEVRWQFEAHRPPQSVRLTTLLSGRIAKKTGGKS